MRRQSIRITISFCFESLIRVLGDGKGKDASLVVG